MNVTFVDETEDFAGPRGLADLAITVMESEGLPADTELGLMLVDRARMAELNETYMGKQGPTDVLSFPVEDLEPGVRPTVAESGPPFGIGDVVICPDVVAENAAGGGIDFNDEMALMTVHGVLHLLGYDHVDDDDAEVMEARERELLESVGRTRR